MNGTTMPWRVAQAAARVIAVLVLVVSGGYLLVYLYRWQWNRAVVSGIFFIASLVTFSTALVLGAIRRLSVRIDELEGSPRAGASPADLAAGDLRAGGAERATRHFDWLDDPGRMGVFIPVLLGAGVILSALTWMLERLAGMLAGATVDRATAELLAPDLPLGPLAAVSGPTIRSEVPSQNAAGRVLGIVAAVAALALLLGAGVYVLRNSTMSRPDTTSSVGTTSIELSIRSKDLAAEPGPTAEALWVTCRSQVARSVDAPLIDVHGPDRVQMVLDTRLGEIRRRRFFGCLEDLSLDLVQARVEGFTLTPAA